MKYKSIILFYCLILLNACSSPKKLFQNEDEEKILVFLCIGQSNMARRADIMPSDTLELKNVLLFNDSSKWEIAKNPLNRYSNIRKDISMQKLGPSWTFVKKMSEVLKDKKIGLVVNAKGGSSIDEWKKGGEYYEKTIIRAKEAQKTGIIKGLIWHQGESDQNKSEVYTDKFIALVENIRNDLGIYNLPVIVGEIGHWKESSKNINMVISNLKNHIKYLEYVKTNDLESLGDKTHFNTESQSILGERYAIKFLELTNSSAK